MGTPILQMENCNISWLNNLPKITELVKVKDGVSLVTPSKVKGQIQAVWLQTHILICYTALPLYVHLLCALYYTKQIRRKHVEVTKGKTADIHGGKRLFSGGIVTSQLCLK